MQSTIVNVIPQMEPWFGDEEAKSCYEYMKSGYFITEYHKTKEFEKMICDYTGAKHCIVTNNGTVSLIMALMSLDIGKGDRVIVPNFTMIATPNAVKMVGATIDFVDIEEMTLTMDLNQVKKLITPETKAIMYVSMNARFGDLNTMVQFCKDHNLYLIHDAAQSICSFNNGKNLGMYGDIASFSFSPPKIISTGQGGALITNDDTIALKLKKIKDFGRERGGADYHDVFGLNFKFTDLQACVGIEQMKKLSWRANRMKKIWNIYYSKLSCHSKITMIKMNNDGWCVWFVDVYVDNPDELQNFLEKNNIGSRRVYPACNSQKIYKEYNDMLYPITEKWSSRGLWLPSSSKLTDDQINYICDKILEFYA